jgi:hypothetical protein
MAKKIDKKVASVLFKKSPGKTTSKSKDVVSEALAKRDTIKKVGKAKKFANSVINSAGNKGTGKTNGAAKPTPLPLPKNHKAEASTLPQPGNYKPEVKPLAMSTGKSTKKKTKKV